MCHDLPRRDSDSLAGRLLEMQDEERRRLARELHDTTVQNLGALSINLSILLATAGIDARAREGLKESIALTRSCLEEIRTMSSLLHPPLLDELGLESALRAYADGYSDRTGLQLVLEFPLHMPRMTKEMEIAIFRIVQEGLANIRRHSGSQTATLSVKHEPDRVEMELVDYGCEWDVTFTPGTGTPGTGIASIRERARYLGGLLTIVSGETGTSLHVVLPLHPQQLDTAVRRS
jgi:signal transduction histidine kinase